MFTVAKIAAKDEWDFEYLGDSNHPFIKANYPHHEGIWYVLAFFLHSIDLLSFYCIHTCPLSVVHFLRATGDGEKMQTK